MNGNTVVIKAGGSVLKRLHPTFFSGCASLLAKGIRVVIVHGGGPEIGRVQQKWGLSPQFVNGLRVTDDEGLEVVQMVLAGLVNKRLVTALEQSGALAFGLSGVDRQLIRVRRKDPSLGWVGEVDSVRAEVLHPLLQAGWIPVIASLGRDEAGHHYNVNADTAAAAIARSLGADRLWMVTDVPGIRTDAEGKGPVLPLLTPDRVRSMMADGSIAGGMIPKAEAALNGLEGSIQEVGIIDGSAPFSLAGGQIAAGTVIRREEAKQDGVISHLSS
ncbi:acetylglutamate kinase [Desmospora profundinema]|uniref:Acetylglutamate kinase n=1 Tax=Desmospora profundinema TaxID=1571184 RepID=A0ABU1ILC5_9BACL|nr:acetylglutamate kinase [Desmospora profundinema]MDR6225581.1 acetylglutamate kinase [Desmospora profundinema]